jgi:FdrA protein
VICALDAAGLGVSQAIGCGGRDLDDAVGGSTMVQALQLLKRDPETDAIIVVGKPANGRSLDSVCGAIRSCVEASKQVVVSIVGLVEPKPFEQVGARIAPTLAGAVRLLGTPAAVTQASDPWNEPESIAVERGEGRLLYAAYCGGTLLAEAKSMATSIGLLFAADSHTAIDFGDDQYTYGRPHPMIDPTVRNKHITSAIADPRVGVVLADIVLGTGGLADPVTPVIEAVARGRQAAQELRRSPSPLLVHVVGTEADPLPRAAAIAQLRAAQVHVADSHLDAVRSAVAALSMGRS